MYLRSAFVCALLALVACSSAQDLAKCKSDGTAEGVKVAQEVCTSVLAACKGGKKWPGYSAARYFPDECQREAFMGCAYPSPTGTKCEGAPGPGKPVPGCTERDFKGLYEGESGDRCAKFVSTLEPSPKVPAGTTKPTTSTEVPAAENTAGGTAGEETGTAAVPQAGGQAAQEGTAGGAEPTGPQAGGEQQPQGAIGGVAGGEQQPQGVAGGGRRMK